MRWLRGLLALWVRVEWWVGRGAAVRRRLEGYAERARRASRQWRACLRDAIAADKRAKAAEDILETERHDHLRETARLESLLTEANDEVRQLQSLVTLREKEAEELTRLNEKFAAICERDTKIAVMQGQFASLTGGRRNAGGTQGHVP